MCFQDWLYHHAHNYLTILDCWQCLKLQFSILWNYSICSQYDFLWVRSQWYFNICVIWPWSFFSSLVLLFLWVAKGLMYILKVQFCEYQHLLLMQWYANTLQWRTVAFYFGNSVHCKFFVITLHNKSNHIRKYFYSLVFHCILCQSYQCLIWMDQ